ncbi:MAG: hypothetical protein AAF394_05295 [Planctomycetota bacterium]
MNRSLKTARRNGVVLICVLACIVVVTSLIATSLMAASRARREARSYQQMSQVKWMLDLGVRRAKQGILSEESYSGETILWEDPAWPEHQLRIEIKLAEQTDSESEEIVQVQASMARILSTTDSEPKGLNEEIRRSHEFRLPQSATD